MRASNTQRQLNSDIDIARRWLEVLQASLRTIEHASGINCPPHVRIHRLTECKQKIENQKAIVAELEAKAATALDTENANA